MKPTAPKTEASPSTQLRKEVFGGSQLFLRPIPKTLVLATAILLTHLAAHAANSGFTKSLAGTWRFSLDAKNEGVAGEWFKRELAEHIEMPASCEQRGFGEKVTKPAVGKLTHVFKYVGPAWYQRDLVIPRSWFGRRVEMFLERCHWETTVWVDGKKIGSQNSLCVPHLYDLGQLAPGRHVLTICVDNSYKLRIGDWAHAITEETQGNWNGIVGKMELRATDPVWIRTAQVYHDKLKVSVGNQTANSIEAKVANSSITVPVGGGEFEIPFTPPANEKLWDEFTPVTHTLRLKLTAGKFSDEKEISYGVRTLGTKNKQFIINGRPVLLRGPVDECVYPLTGYAPMDKASWLRVLKICRSYGFNFMRFHSWCPPEAAFAAADEVGLLFQVELPVWARNFGKDAPRDKFLFDELDRILETYGNHPSFGLMAMGNESGGSLDTLVKAGRAKDWRELFRCENGNTPDVGDYSETGQRGVVGPRTDWDRWSASPGWIAGGESTNRSTGPTVPTLAHEVGQWAMYENFDEIKKFTGVFRAKNYEASRDSLAAHHMLDLAEPFRQASGKFMVELYKDEIEASIRTSPYGGFEILEARDYTGQGTAIVGWLDAFWDSKGLITPEKFREFCAPTVCLLRMPKRVYESSETFSAEAQFAHYGPKSIEVRPTWKITDECGHILDSGKLPKRKIETGSVESLGNISAGLGKIASPQKLTVTLSAGDKSNSWNIWVFPPAQMETPSNVRVAYALDQSVRDSLAAGENVVLLSSPKEGVIHPKLGMRPKDRVRLLPPAQPGTNALPGSFLPMFWNARLFNQTGTLGLLCDPNHPALAGFPTDNHSDWQWADLLGRFSATDSFRVAGAPEDYCADFERSADDVRDRSKSIILDDTPPEFRPIVQVIDNYDRNSKLGVIFETRVGKGKLLVCAMDLETDADKRPAARQLRKSLVDYASGKQFQPTFELLNDLLTRILTTNHQKSIAWPRDAASHRE